MRILLTISTLFLSAIIYAQDIHYSQFWAAPIYYNPANTGVFKGDYRFMANQRLQHSSITDKPYSTFGFSADARDKLVKNLGLGAQFLYDVAGQSRFSTLQFQVSGSYRWNFLKNNDKHAIIPGIQIGLIHRNIKDDNLTYDNQYNGFYFDENINSGESFPIYKFTNFSLNSGFLYEYKESDRNWIRAGVALFNMTRPKQSLFKDDEIVRDFRTSISAQVNWKIDRYWDIIPSILMSIQGKYLEPIIGTEARYYINDDPRDFLALRGGLWYRNQDAMYISFGADYMNWTAGFSYDLNLSKLRKASRVRGAFEFSLSYRLIQYKPKKIQHRVCPDYM